MATTCENMYDYGVCSCARCSAPEPGWLGRSLLASLNTPSASSNDLAAENERLRAQVLELTKDHRPRSSGW